MPARIIDNSKPIIIFEDSQTRYNLPERFEINPTDVVDEQDQMYRTILRIDKHDPNLTSLKRSFDTRLKSSRFIEGIKIIMPLECAQDIITLHIVYVTKTQGKQYTYFELESTLEDIHYERKTENGTT